jgi:hypothetical protein
MERSRPDKTVLEPAILAARLPQLLDERADLSLLETTAGDTPLTVCTAQCDWDMVARLLEEGVGVEVNRAGELITSSQRNDPNGVSYALPWRAKKLLPPN